MTESKTPRTDDLARGNHVVPTEFAEQLETELNEAKFDLEFRRDLYKIKELEIDGLKRAVKELSDDLQELRSVRGSCRNLLNTITCVKDGQALVIIKKPSKNSTN